MRTLILLSFLILSSNLYSQNKLNDKNYFWMLKFSNIENAKKCVNLFYKEGIQKDIIEKDNEYYIEIEKDEIKMKSINHKSYILPRKWIKNNIEYFEVFEIGETSIGEGFIN
jgi:hypothetical protein